MIGRAAVLDTASPPSRLRSVVVACGLYALLGGAISFAGYVFDVQRLTDWDGNGISIQPNAAVCAALSGLALLLLAVKLPRSALACGACVLLIGGATLAEWITGVSLGHDGLLLMGRPWGRTGVVVPGRMGPPGALCWTLVGAALVVTAAPDGGKGRKGWSRLARTAPALALIAATVSALSLIGYLYGADMLFTLPRLTVIALQTATFIFAVSLAIMALHPAREPARTLIDPGGAGVIARRVVPVLVGAAVGVGLLIVRSQGLQALDIGMGAALLVVALLVLVLPAMWRALHSVRSREAALTAGEQRLRAAVAAGEFGLWEFDPVTKAVRWDGRQHEIFGIDRSVEPTQEALLARVPPEDAEELRLALAATLATGRDYQVEFRFLRPDGRTIWVLGRGGLVTLPGRKEGSGERVLVGVNKDITLYKATERLLEERLAQRTKELVETQAALHRKERLAGLGTLAAGIGHDLSNLTMPMRLRVEAMLGDDPSPGAREDLEAIAEALEFLRRLSAGLRQMAADGAAPVPAGGTDVVQWWSEVQGLMRTVLPRHVRLEADFPAPPPDGKALPPVNVGKAGLTQAVFNLVQNAGEAMRDTPNGVVTVGARLAERPAREKGSGVLLTVRDNGPGMTPEVLGRCFDPYFSTKGRAVATGMGLSLVRATVEGAGGSVEVDSDPGRATAFTLLLPAWTPQDLSATPRRTAQPSITSERG